MAPNDTLYEVSPRLTPSAMAQHYGIPVSATNGAGQSVAIISLGGPLDKSEILADLKAIGSTVNPANLAIKHVNSPSTTGESGETHLDVEVIGAICPAAAITIYRCPNNFTRGFAPAVVQAVDDGNQVISISWGASEDPGFEASGFGAAFVHAAKKSVTVTVATGDGGSANQRHGNQAIGAWDGKAHVQMPGVSPWVLACGGSEMLSNGAEIAWNNAPYGGGATGGGVSDYVPRPSFQKGLNIASVNTGFQGRIVPDVAALASFSSWQISMDGGTRFMPNGGTSAVAPFWASIAVLINQLRTANGKQPIGFLNDHLYALAATYPGLFRNITQGANYPYYGYPGYTAGPGYDACCGWGSPTNACQLIDTLAQVPDRDSSWFDTVK